MNWLALSILPIVEAIRLVLILVCVVVSLLTVKDAWRIYRRIVGSNEGDGALIYAVNGLWGKSALLVVQLVIFLNWFQRVDILAKYEVNHCQFLAMGFEWSLVSLLVAGVGWRNMRAFRRLQDQSSL